jgi:hypothetical protein
VKKELHHPSIPPTPIIDKNESAPTTVALVLQTSSLPTEQESPAHYSTKAYSIHDLPPHQEQHIGLTETAAEKERKKKKGRQPHTAVQYNTPCPKKEKRVDKLTVVAARRARPARRRVPRRLCPVATRTPPATHLPFGPSLAVGRAVLGVGSQSRADEDGGGRTTSSRRKNH